MTIKIDPVTFEVLVTLTHEEAEKHTAYTIVDEIYCAMERNESVRKLVEKRLNENEVRD